MKRTNRLGICALIAVFILATFVTNSLAVDGTVPTITGFTPDNSSIQTSANFGISFTVTDTDDSIRNSNYFIKLDGNAITSKLAYPGHWQDNPDTESYDWVIDNYKQATIAAGVTGAKDGVHTVDVQAMDSSGNVVNKTWNFTVAVKPTFANLSPADGAVSATNTGFSVKVSDNDAINPSSITAELDGQPVDTTFDTATGVVAYKATIPDGLHRAQVTVSDAAGNTTSREWSFTVATAGPSLSFISNTTMETANFTLGFKAADQYSDIQNANYSVKLDGVLIPAKLDYPGHWEDDPATNTYNWVIDTCKEATISAVVSGAKDGVHSVEVQATNKVGKTTNKTWSFTVAVKPTFANLTPADGTATADNTGFSLKVSDNSALDPSSITAQLDGNSVNTTFDSTTGMLAYKSTIPDGTHKATVAVSDAAGNTASKEWSFIVVTTGPTLSFNGKDQTFTTARPMLVLDMQSIVDVSDKVTVKIDDAEVPAAFTYLGHTETDYYGDYYVVDSYKQGTIRCTPPSLKDGTHKLTVTAKDKLGNTSTGTWNFGVRQPPAFSELSPVNGDVVTVKPVIKAKITDNGSVNPDSVSMSIDNTAVTPEIVDNLNGTYTVTYTADDLNTDSTHTVTLAAADMAGNEASTAWKFFASAIGQQTGFMLQSPADQSGVNLAKPVISVHFTDLSRSYDTANLSMAIDNGTTLATTVTGKDTEFLISSTPQSLTDGKHIVYVTIPSLTGAQPISTSWSFTVNAPPAITKTSPTSVVTSTTPTLAAYASDNSTVASGKFTLDGQTLAAALDTHFNRLSVKAPSALANGPHAVTLTVLDAAGNSTTSKWSFTVDANTGKTYPDMPVATNATCWGCHTQEYNLKHVAPTQCRQCHTEDFTSLPVNAQAFRDCIGCHYNNTYITGRHASDRTWVWSNLPNDRHPVNDEHLSPTTECTQCHSRILTQEHNRPENKDKNGNPITCDTCHGQTYLATVSSEEANAVKNAIVNKDTKCETCHAQTLHVALHDSQFDSKCTGSGCHNANIENEHLNNVTTSGKGYSCNTCHASTNNKVLSAIRNGQVSCNNCHTTAHKVPLVGNLPTDIPQFEELVFSQPIEAAIFADDPGLPAGFADNYKAGLMVLSNRSNNISPGEVWDFYNSELTKKGWVLSSEAPDAAAAYFAAEFKRAGRLLTVRCYNTVFGDNTGASTSGYRVDIWYN